MNRAIISMYRLLLYLYPTAFRHEFAEQMLLDFSDLATDASKHGAYSLLCFCIREFIALPSNYLKAYWMEWHMNTALVTQPMRYALRGALGFGLLYAMTFPVTRFIYDRLSFIDSFVTRLQVDYYDRYQVERSFEWISRIPYVLSLLLMGLVLGILFSILFAERSRYTRYVLIGSLGWILSNLMGWALSFNFRVFLEETQLMYFNTMALILSGAIWGWILAVAKSARRDAVHRLAISMFTFPFFTYLCVSGLFDLFVFQTPWRLISLMILMVLLVVSVLIMARNLDTQRKFPWIVVVTILGHLCVRPSTFFISRLLYPPMVALDTTVDSFSITVSNIIYGAIFGSFLGLILGFQKKNNTQQAGIQEN